MKTNIDEINYFSTNLKRDVKIYVYNPAPDKKLPVIYMHDGQNLFYKETSAYGKWWKIDELLKDNNMEYVVVGIECSKELFGRVNEYSFHKCEKVIKEYKFDSRVGGKGPQYLDEVFNHIKPMIEQKYNVCTDRENIAMMGSSLGGNISLQAMLNYNIHISKFGCLSNAFWFCENGIANDCQKFETNKDIKLYLDVGDKEANDAETCSTYIDSNQRIADIIIPKVTGKFKIIKDGIHSEESWNSRFIEILKYLFK